MGALESKKYSKCLERTKKQTIHISIFWTRYSRRRIYQNNEDDFRLNFFISNKLGNTLYLDNCNLKKVY